MKYIGLDIGTTTISALLIDGQSGKTIARITRRNVSGLESSHKYEYIQDPEKIFAICQAILCELMAGISDIGGIGLTGQMHGIVYVDENGMACSNLVTWQDERGNSIYRGQDTYCQFMEKSGAAHVATGYGLVTLFFDTVNHQIPRGAVSICTIADYVAMRLSGRRRPLIHVSNAASLGLFDPEHMEFELGTIRLLGMREELLPEISKEECIIGRYADNIPVAIPIGDNQASFLGSVKADSNVLVNIGTGSQLSILNEEYRKIEGFECRPYLDGKYLINGSSLCGGSAYQLLEDFFREVLKLFSAEPAEDLMKRMDEAAEKAEDTRLCVDTRFRGTRKQPELRGSITEISTENFRPGDLAYATMKGICEELYHYYRKLSNIPQSDFLVASGNGVRNSRIERRILSEVFGMSIHIPENAEEAAFGAALNAVHAREQRTWEQIQSLISYRTEGI